MNNELVNLYIGKNAYKINNSGFSIWTFLFGPLYLWYRKMYGLTALWILYNTILNIIGNLIKSNNIFLSLLLLILYFLPNIIIAVLFKDLYIKHVNKKIEKIKNTQKSSDLNSIIAKKRWNYLDCFYTCFLNRISLYWLLPCDRIGYIKSW